jgi:hypothetical protein
MHVGNACSILCGVVSSAVVVAGGGSASSSQFWPW